MTKDVLSVILPVYNEGKILKKNVNNLVNTLESMPFDFEIIISEDGSTDETVEVAKSLECKNIRVLNNGKRKGKGAAIKRATAHAKGNIIIFTDADLASHPNQIKQLVKMLNSGSAIVVASRYHADSRTRRTFLRYFASKSFNFLVKVVLGSKLTDHQCGFKAFRKNPVITLINEVEDEKWFWDTELLVRAQRSGLKITEIPVVWTEEPDSKFRLLSDTCHMARSLLMFKLKHG